LRTEHGVAINNEGWRTAYPKLVGSGCLHLNRLRICPGVKALIKGSRVQIEVDCKFFKVILAESALVLAILAGKQLIMVLPELILVAGTLAGLSRPLRFFSQESHVPVTKPDLAVFHIRIFDLTLRASGKSAAVWSLKIAEFEQRDWSVGIPLEMLHLGQQVIH
jgi:hypothetical protein